MGFELIFLVASFTIVVLAAKDIGKASNKLGLPYISGFILTGVIVGPFMLVFIDKQEAHTLEIIDLIALPFIAFLAGAELHLDELRRNLKSIITILFSIVVIVYSAGVAAFMLFSDFIPFAAGRPYHEIVAIGIIGGSILVAKSPSSIVALIKELRAKGPFIQTALGVTILMDAVVIVAFTVSISVADVLIREATFNAPIIFLLIGEIAGNVVSGVFVGYLLRVAMSLRFPLWWKTAVVLLIGFLVSSFAHYMHHNDIPYLPFPIFSEALLICMVAGLYVSNYTRYSSEFERMLEKAAPFVFICFFTAIGTEIDLDVLRASWGMALILVLVRLVGMYTGCFLGGTLAGNPAKHNRLLGLTFITQAGISLGLAKQVALLFPGWGSEFTTLMVAVIVVNTLVGPACAKFAIIFAGEAHVRGEHANVEDTRRVIIFGVEDQSRALARQLEQHNWFAVMVDVESSREEPSSTSAADVKIVSDVSVETMRSVGVDKVDTVVCMLDNDTNYRICELAYEHFGTEHLVVRLDGGADVTRFQELGVAVVDPGSSIVNLLDHCVRSPAATSLFLGEVTGQDVVEVTMKNRQLHGVALRDLHFPADTLIIALRRRGQLLLSHGYTRLRIDDEITVVGSDESLEQVCLRLEA